MTDPRFRQPSSGLYWQVESKDGKLLRSRSLWDGTLTTGGEAWRDIDEPEAFDGPFGEPVLIHAKLISLGEGADRQQFRVMIAVNESEVTRPSQHFAANLYLSLLVLGLAMLVVSSAQLGMVMSPINNLRKRSARRSGRQAGPGFGHLPGGDRPGGRHAELAPRAARADGGTCPLAGGQLRP